MTEAPVVAMRDIRKSFDASPVLKGVDFVVRRGEVDALAGENGAGKSTLMKILQGVYTADSGDIEVDGATVDGARRAGPRRGHRHGVPGVQPGPQDDSGPEHPACP